MIDRDLLYQKVRARKAIVYDYVQALLTLFYLVVRNKPISTGGLTGGD